MMRSKDEYRGDAAVQGAGGRILLADPDLASRERCLGFLEKAGLDVEAFGDATAATRAIAIKTYDAVICDAALPPNGGIDLVRTLRRRHPDLPALLMGSDPAVETVVAAMEHGVLRFLTKPLDLPELERVARYAIHFQKMANLKRLAVEYLASMGGLNTDRETLETNFARALDAVWMAYQPIVRFSSKEPFGFEALLRSTDVSLSHPATLLDAAVRLGRLSVLGKRVRDTVAADSRGLGSNLLLFVNIHPHDLRDENLFDGDSPLTAVAHRVVLEITERTSLDAIPDARARIGQLRMLGYRIAVDDLGAGYAGLASVALLEPEIIKIDMSLVRNLDKHPLKQQLVGSMVSACRNMGIDAIAEGVETTGERDALLGLGCDLMQGYLFARPGPGFPKATF